LGCSGFGPSSFSVSDAINDEDRRRFRLGREFMAAFRAVGVSIPVLWGSVKAPMAVETDDAA
jgi:hypothetical protein